MTGDFQGDKVRGRTTAHAGILLVSITSAVESLRSRGASERGEHLNAANTLPGSDTARTEDNCFGVRSVILPQIEFTSFSRIASRASLCPADLRCGQGQMRCAPHL